MPGSACTAPASKWTRGASTAAATSIPSATRRTIVWRTAERIRFEPPLPSPASSSPSRSSTVGDIIEGMRRPAGRVWKPNGFRSSSPSMLLTWTPVPGTIRPEPVPFEQVTLAQRPSPSTAVMWVVEPSRSPGPATPSPGGRRRDRARSAAASSRARVEEQLQPAVLVEPGVKLLGARGLRLLHHRDHLLDPGRAEPVEQVEAEGDQDAPR